MKQFALMALPSRTVSLPIVLFSLLVWISNSKIVRSSVRHYTLSHHCRYLKSLINSHNLSMTIQRTAIVMIINILRLHCHYQHVKYCLDPVWWTVCEIIIVLSVNDSSQLRSTRKEQLRCNLRLRNVTALSICYFNKSSNIILVSTKKMP